MSISLRQLLAQRFAPTTAPGDEYEALGVLADALNNPSDRERSDRALRLVSENPEWVAVLLALDQLQPTPADSLLRRTGPGAASLIALAASVVILAVALRPKEEELTPKGPGDRIHVLLERGGARSFIGDGQHVLDGDHLGFSYSSRTGGFLAVLAYNGSQGAQLLYPTHGRTGLIEPGGQVPLPDGALVEAPRPCEWIVAVFADRPLDLGEIAAQLERSATWTIDCALSSSIAGARSVQALRLRGHAP